MISIPSLEKVVCALCGSHDSDIVLSGRDLIYHLPGEFSVVRCRNCRLLYTNPRPSPASISIYYPDYYGPHLEVVKRDCQKHHSTVNGKGFKKWASPIIKKFLDSGSTSLPPFESPGKMLEVGCAWGKFLSSMKDRGWETWGLEFAEKPAKYARDVLGLNVIQGKAEEFEFPEESFDLVVAWMVIEHLHDPVGVLTRISRMLKKSGYFAFSIPNAGSWEFKYFERYWYALQLPTHLYHFTTTSIRDMLKKAGFRIEKIIFQRCMINVITSLGFFLFELFGGSKYAKTLIRYPEKAMWYIQLSLLPVATMIALFRQSGRITVWAKKV